LKKISPREKKINSSTKEYQKISLTF